jgi:hypothetical protein
MKYLDIYNSNSIDSILINTGINTVKGLVSSWNLIFYLILGLIILGFVIDRFFGLKKMLVNLNNLFSKEKDFDYLDNYKTIVKYLNSNNRDMFITSCTYMNNHSRITKEIQQTLVKIIMKEDKFKNQEWITFEIRSIAMNFLCTSFVKNEYLFTKVEPLYIKDIKCPRIDSFVNEAE